jgi:hypothetical protein
MIRSQTPGRPTAQDPRGHDLYSTPPEHLRPSRANRIGMRTLDIANRLRFVCAAMPDDELIALACRMAVVEDKYASGDGQAEGQGLEP